MDDKVFLAARFEEARPHLRAVAYRMLGSFSEADDALQEAWLRLSRSDADAIENLGGWLTTVTARVCLNMLRSRQTRREDPLEIAIPDPIVTRAEAISPEDEAVLSDSVGLALLVVLETLTPAERLAFVLHDMFAVPFEEIGEMVGRTPEASRQLASRARRRVQGAAPVPDPDLNEQRRVVDAFFAAAHSGDFDALVKVLHPDITLRSAFAAGTRVVEGAENVASQALMFRSAGHELHPALINGAAGVVVMLHGRVNSLMAFTVSGGRVVEIDAIADPARLQELDLDLN
jgi:RNA polymerase sigma factor (sigma-70 family)